MTHGPAGLRHPARARLALRLPRDLRAVFLFLIAPILIIIPLSFNAEPYFTFTEKMLRLDPSGYSLRWYDRLLTFGMVDARRAARRRLVGGRLAQRRPG